MNTELVRERFSWLTLGAKYILQSFSMKVPGPEELMCHTAKRADHR